MNYPPQKKTKKNVYKEKKTESLWLLSKILTFDVVRVLLRLNYSKSNKTCLYTHCNHSNDKSLSWVSKKAAEF